MERPFIFESQMVGCCFPRFEMYGEDGVSVSDLPIGKEHRFTGMPDDDICSFRVCCFSLLFFQCAQVFFTALRRIQVNHVHAGIADFQPSFLWDV